jgi:hypothetical protein
MEARGACMAEIREKAAGEEGEASAEKKTGAKTLDSRGCLPDRATGGSLTMGLGRRICGVHGRASGTSCRRRAEDHAKEIAKNNCYDQGGRGLMV